MAEPLLLAAQLSCERDDRLLFDGLNVVISPGTLTRIEGPNGAGKTTLLRILAGLSSDYSGTLNWRGQPVTQVREQYHREMLYLGHRPGIKALLTPLENLRSLLAPRRAVAEDDLWLALAQVGLGGFEDVPCHNLSAGQQRRVALARLHLSDEPLWLLDEAFTAIDKDGVKALEHLLEARTAQGGAVVMTTHHALGVARVQRILLGLPGMQTLQEVI